jgi:hypothetical protein
MNAAGNWWVQVMDAALEDAAVLRAMPESEWLQYVISEARAQGWLVHHDFDKREHNRVPDPGFPDLCLARAGVVIFAELKRQTRSNPSPAQYSWAAALACNDQHEFFVWRPSHWPEIRKILA